MRPSPPARVARRLWLRLVIAVCLALLLLEGAVRARQWWMHGTTLGLIALEWDETSGLMVPLAGSKRGPIGINSLGFRGPEIELPKPAGRLRVAVLGGSTSFCAQCSADDKVWPHRVVEMLAARYPELEFDYVNAGVPGFTTVQSLANLKHRVGALEPDLVLIYHATNDLTHDSRILAVEQGVADPKTLEDTKESWSLAWNLLWKNLRYRERTTAHSERAALAFEPGQLSRSFEGNLRALVEAAGQAAPCVGLITFSHRFRRDQPPDWLRACCASSLYYMPYMTPDKLLDAFDELNRVIRETARASGIILIEGEDTIPGQRTYFVDSVHFNDAGAELMAERVFEGLLAAPAFGELLAATAVH